jgi:hypothetical protein
LLDGELLLIFQGRYKYLINNTIFDESRQKLTLYFYVLHRCVY